MRKIVHIVIPVNIATANKRVEIEKGIPSYATELLGISFSIPTPVENGDPIQQVALISVDINNRDTDVITTGIGYNPHPQLKNPDGYFSVEQPLKNNSRATIRVIDLNTFLTKDGAFTPYTINVYLKCLKKTV